MDSLIKKYKLGECVITNSEVSRKESLERQKNAQLLLLLTWNNPKEIGILTGKLLSILAQECPFYQ